MDYYKFYELYTEFGNLLIYEKYKGEREAFPETREFFTNEKAKPGYDTLTFNNGKSTFRTRKRNAEGYIVEEYTKEIEPFEFLERVDLFISSETERQMMIKRTYDFFKLKEEKGQGKIIIPPKPASIDEMNEIAIRTLKSYIK